MLKYTIMLGLFVNLLLFTAISYALPAMPASLWITAEDDSRPLLLSDGKLTLIAITKHTDDRQKHININVRYPKISGTVSTPAAQHFNQLIQQIIQQQITQFTQELTDTSISTNILPATLQNKLTINYALASFVSQAKGTIFISIRFAIDAYQRGMAHPLHRIITLNYDLGHQQQLSLAQLFKSDSPYLTTIANYCQHFLQNKHLPNQNILDEGTSLTANNYQHWNLTLSGLLITFDEAQVAPRYFGAQQVLIPYSELASILNSQTACTVGVIRCDIT